MASTRAVREALIAIAHDLERAADACIDGRERQAMLAASRQLGVDPIARAARIPDALSQRALRCLELSRRQASENGGLTLMAHEALEAQILAGALASAVREQTGAEYEDYVNRIRRVVGGRWSDDDANPLGARTLSAAVVTTVAGVASTAGVRNALRQSLCRHLAAPLAVAIVSADATLKAEGISPAPDPADVEADAQAARNRQSDQATDPGPREPQPPVPSPIIAVNPGPPAGELPPSALHAPDRRAQTEASADSTVRGRGEAPPAPSANRRPTDIGDRTALVDHDAVVLGTSPLATHRAPPPGTALASLQSIAALEGDAVALAHSAGMAPYTREARGEFFGRARRGLSQGGASPAQLAVLDVVSAMFDYAVDERRMPEPAKPLIWRLQQPALALALLDPAYLGDEPRSLRRLVEHVAAISVAFSDDLTRGSELYRRLETVVRAVEIVTGALQTRSSVMARQVEREYSRAAQHVGQLIERIARERQSLEAAPDRRNRRDFARRPGAERERDATERIRALIGERLGEVEVPESVREFLFNVWLRHLRTAALRNGEESNEFRAAMEVVDDLVWSLDAGDGGSRRELAERIPPLIRLMTRGMREIGAKDDEYRAFFDELFLIHLRRMQRRRRGASKGWPSSVGQDTGSFPADEDGSTIVLAHGVPDIAAGAQPGLPPAPRRVDDVAARPVAARNPVGGAGPAGTGARGDPPEAADRRLLEILGTLDLDDLGDAPHRRTLPPDEAIVGLSRGDWVELIGREGGATMLKVAWINQRRTVALLVRRSDRRALSMRMEELKTKLGERRAYLLGR